MKKRIVFLLIVLLSLLLSPNLIYADNAIVLPKGISRVRVEGNFFFPVSEQYDDDGNREDVAADFNNTLNSSVFPSLNLIEQGFGMPAGSAVMGSSIVDYEYNFNRIYLYGEYGLFDKMTIGFRVPYWWAKNDVSARVDTTNATVGKSATGTAVGAPIAPFGAFGDEQPLSTADVQNLLGVGLDTNNDGAVDIPGFGFKPIESWSRDGIGDIRVGLRYKYLDTDAWRLAFTGGLQIPTGYSDDPDSLVDYGWSADAYTLLFQFNNDYKGFNNLLLNTTLKYYLLLPDSKEVRVLSDPARRISRIKEDVDRNLGDIFEIEASGMYSFTNAFSGLLLYRYGYKLEDSIDGDLGLSYSGLEDETSAQEHLYMVGLRYSTIKQYQEKKFPVPLNASVWYRNRFAGRNLFKSQYIGLELQVMF